MTHSGTILFLDDDDDFRKPLTKLLEYKKYRVLEATTIEEAEQILADHWIHMATIDLSMTGDRDDRGGMWIINNDKYTSIPKVILTGHGYDPDLIRDTFKEGLVVDFIDKHEKDHEQRLINAFVDNVRINWDLQIRWDSEGLRSSILLASLLIPHEDKSYLLYRIDELEDLLRQLFLGSKQITVGRLLVFNGGVAWIEVFSVDANEQEAQFIVACGRKHLANHQREQYRTFVPQSNNVGNLKLADTAETLRFSAMAFDCIGGNLAEMLPLEKIVLHRPQQDVVEILKHAFESTLAYWHNETCSTNDISTLSQLHTAWTGKEAAGLDADDWQGKFESLCRDLSRVVGSSRIICREEQVVFQISETFSQTYPNPIQLLFDEGLLLNTAVTIGTVHGHLHLSDILVDIQQKATWLLDFSQTRQGPIVLDFVALETALKAELLKMVDIETWCMIEQKLLIVKNLDEPIDVDKHSPEVQKLIDMISTIRKRASMVIPEGIKSYVAGLYMHSLCQIRSYNEDELYSGSNLISYIPHIITATLAGQRLLPPREFIVDIKNKVVTVEGKSIQKLSGLGWKIIQYLYSRAGQLCSYEDILRTVWKDDENDITNGAWMLDSGRPKVNARIVDLRKRLEPIPKQPKYILLIHDQGYKLEL